MKKPYVVTSLITIFTIPLLLFAASFFLSPKNPSKKIAPSPSTQGTLTVLKTSPSLNQKGVPASQVISIEFNKTLLLSDISIIFSPQTQYGTSINGTILSLSPSLSLSRSTNYVVTISSSDHKNLIYSLIFSTEGPIPTLIDTRPSEEPQKTDELLKKDRPDAFLSNKMPYKTAEFGVVYSFKSSPTGHFAFTVTLTGENKDIAKTMFVNWVKSFGITDAQIDQLDITYR